MTEDFNPITLEGLNSSSEVHYFNNNVSFFEPVVCLWWIGVAVSSKCRENF